VHWLQVHVYETEVYMFTLSVVWLKAGDI